MSAKVKLSIKLPGEEEINGLDSIVDELLDDPNELRVAIVVFDVPKTNIDNRHGTKVPVIEHRQYEPLGVLSELDPKIRELVLNAREKRTGKTPLPLDMVTVDETLDDGDDD